MDSSFASRRKLLGLLGMLGAGCLTLLLCGGVGYLFVGWYVGLFVGGALALGAAALWMQKLVARHTLRKVTAKVIDEPRIPGPK